MYSNLTDMKKIICACMVALLPLGMQAQTKDVTPTHLDFMGVPIGGSIDEFNDRIQPRFRLKKRVAGENQYIYEGPMFGYNTYIQVNFTRKSRTVYRVLVTPKGINQMAWEDSLHVRYGEPENTRQGQLWQRPEGMILYYTPEGYDSALIYLDALGNNAFKEEK